METREYRTVDKSTWGPGPWQDEPDKMQWQDEATGLPCLIVRGPSGALCGYVGVAEGHPLFGQWHHDIVGIEVHGDLTFSSFCTEGGDEGAHICHVPSPGEPDRVWWLGFDCAHADDIMPRYRDRIFGDVTGSVYRDLAYVKREVSGLARQLKALA